MAERIQVELVDDIDGSEAQYTVTFALDGVTYEIDLSEQNARGLRGVFKPYIERARTAAKEKPRTTKRQEREERQVRQANRDLTEEIRGAARRSRERYQADREDTAQPDAAEQAQDSQDTALGGAIPFTANTDRSNGEGTTSDDKYEPVPVVSLPQFSSAGE